MNQDKQKSNFSVHFFHIFLSRRYVIKLCVSLQVMEAVCSLAVPMKKMTRKQMKSMKLLTKEWMIVEKKEGM